MDMKYTINFTSDVRPQAREIEFVNSLLSEDGYWMDFFDADGDLLLRVRAKDVKNIERKTG